MPLSSYLYLTLMSLGFHQETGFPCTPCMFIVVIEDPEALLALMTVN